MPMPMHPPFKRISSSVNGSCLLSQQTQLLQQLPSLQSSQERHVQLSWFLAPHFLHRLLCIISISTLIFFTLHSALGQKTQTFFFGDGYKAPSHARRQHSSHLNFFPHPGLLEVVSLEAPNPGWELPHPDLASCQLIWLCIFFSNSFISAKRSAMGGEVPQQGPLGHDRRR